MEKNIKYRPFLKILFIFLLLCSGTGVLLPQSEANRENTQQAVSFRLPDSEKLEKFRNDSRFNYAQEEIKIPGWWSQVKRWIADKLLQLGSIIQQVTRLGIVGYLIIGIVIAAIVLLILHLAGVNYATLLGKKQLDSPDIEMYAEDVNTMDFDTLIKNALQNKNFRLATRFLFLKNLKLLSDKEIIHWDINKTNISYLYEIKDNGLQTKFRNISLIFDYVWYGDFPVDDAGFAEVNNRMDEFAKTVANER